MAGLRVCSMRPGLGVNGEVSEKPLEYTAMLRDTLPLVDHFILYTLLALSEEGAGTRWCCG